MASKSIAHPKQVRNTEVITVKLGDYGLWEWQVYQHGKLVLDGYVEERGKRGHLAALRDAKFRARLYQQEQEQIKEYNQIGLGPLSYGGVTGGAE